MASRDMGPITFVSVQSREFIDVSSILKARIPKSATVYNMSLLYPRFADKMKFYAYQEAGVPVDESAWIIATFVRVDYGLEVCISAPPEAVRIPQAMADALEDSFIVWTKPYELISIDSKISAELRDMARRLTKLNPNIKGRGAVEYYSCHHYIQAPSPKAKAAPELPKGTFMAPLNTETGAKVLYDEWPYSRFGTDVQCWDLVTRSYSKAVYLDEADEAPVSWSFLHQCGHLAIQTQEPHRGRGYATRCLRELVDQLTRSGYHPCAMVDEENVASNKAMKSAGMQVSHEVDFIIFGRY